MTNIWPSVQPSKKRTWRLERRRAQGRSCVRGLRGSGQHFLSWETSVSWELLPKVVNRSELTLLYPATQAPWRGPGWPTRYCRLPMPWLEEPALPAWCSLHVESGCPAKVHRLSPGTPEGPRGLLDAGDLPGGVSVPQRFLWKFTMPLGSAKMKSRCFPRQQGIHRGKKGWWTWEQAEEIMCMQTHLHTHTCTHTHMLTSSASWNSPFQLGQLRLSENSFKFIYNKKINCGAIHRT